MAKPRDIHGLEADLPFGDAAALAVATRAEEVWEHEGRALDTGNIEGVHDMRVATRRLRAAMEVFGPVFPKKRHRQALDEVKGLAAVLGERRDPDVMIDGLRALEAQLTKEDMPGIESLVDELRAGQREANELLERTLREVREERLPERLQLLAAEVRA